MGLLELPDLRHTLVDTGTTPSVGLFHYVVAVHCPSEVLRKRTILSELKFLGCIDNFFFFCFDPKGLDSSNNIGSRINTTTFFNFSDMSRRYICHLQCYIF